MVNCEYCNAPNAKKTSFGFYLCGPCYEKKKDTLARNGAGAGIG